MSRLRQSYHLLGLSPEAPERQVRSAYRTLVRTWHPDLFPQGSPQQLQAQERLKEINEAYHLILQELHTPRSESPPPRQPGPPPRAPQEDPPYQGSAFGAGATANGSASGADATFKGGASEAGATPKDPPRQAPPRATAAAPPPPKETPRYPAAAIFPFFTAWENALFLLLVAGSLYFVRFRYGNLALGAWYALRVLTLPLALSLACNSRWGSRRGLWHLYVGTVSLFALLVLKDAVLLAVGSEAAPGYSYAPNDDSGSVGGYGSRGELPATPFSPAWRPPAGGPLSPASPVVPAPAAPLAPAAPAAPAAPLARGAR